MLHLCFPLFIFMNSTTLRTGSVNACACLFAILLVSSALAEERPTLFMRSGRVDGVQDMAVSPDGLWYATVSSGKITIWSTKDGFEYRTLSAGNSPSISIASDNRTIATEYNDGIRLFDVNTAKQTALLKVGNVEAIAKVVFHPHLMLLASLDFDGTVRITNLDTKTEVFHQKTERNTVGLSQLLHFSPDGRFLAVMIPSAIHIYDWERNKEVARFDAYSLHLPNLSRTLKALVINPNGSGSSFQTETAEKIGLYEFSDVAFSSDAKTIAIAHKDEIDIVDLLSGKNLEAVPFLDKGAIQTCLFTSDTRLIVGVVAQNSFTYDLEKHSITDYPAWSVSQFLMIPNTSRLLMNLSNRIGIKDKRGIGQWSEFTANKLASIAQISFSPDGKELVNGTYWAVSPMTVWDLASGEANTRDLPLLGVGSYALSQDETYVAYDGSEGYPNFKVHVWNRKTRHEDLVLPITVPNYPESLAFNADGSRLAAFIGEPKAVRIWSMPDGGELGTIPIEDGGLNKLAWMPDTQILAISQKTGILIVDAKTGSPPKLLRAIDPQAGDPFRVSYGDLHFSPDGKTLAVGGRDQIDLIDSATWSVQDRIPHAEDSCFVYSPDGGYLAYLTTTQAETFVTHSSGLALWSTTEKKIAMQGTDNSTGCPISFHRDGKLLATARDDGIGIVSAATGKVLLTLYRFANDKSADPLIDKSADWLAVTPDGLFDGTAGAWNQMSWRFLDKTFDVAPVELFFREFFHPGLLSDVFEGHKLIPPADISQLDRRQPEVTLSLPTNASDHVSSRQVHLLLDVTESRKEASRIPNGSGARDLRLFRNGTLVQVWRDELHLDANGHAGLTADVPIVAGENRFTAYAFNHDNIKSSDATLVLIGADALKRQGTAYIVAVGINQYAAHTTEQLKNLEFAEADASDFASQFSRLQKSLSQFADVRVVPLLGANATRANMVMALSVLGGGHPTLPPQQTGLFSSVSAVQPEDGVFLFYAGHGTASGKHFYLLPQDFNPQAPLDDPQSKTLSDVDLSHLLETISPARSFLIIDACNSGEALGGDKFVPGPMNSTGLAQLAYEKGLYILAASQGNEYAMEAPELAGGHGYLTYALVEEGLKTQAAAENGSVLLRPWFEFASRRVPGLQSTVHESKTLKSQAAKRKNAATHMKEVQPTGNRGLLPDDDPGAKLVDPGDHARQHPRVFYRREPETEPFVVAKPAVVQSP